MESKKKEERLTIWQGFTFWTTPRQQRLKIIFEPISSLFEDGCFTEGVLVTKGQPWSQRRKKRVEILGLQLS